MRSRRQEGESFGEPVTLACEPGYSVLQRRSEDTTIGKVCVSGCGVRHPPATRPLAQEHTGAYKTLLIIRINILVVARTMATRENSSSGRDLAIAQ